MRRLRREELQNLGSLITYEENGETRCLGDLIDFKERGVFDPNWGKVPVTPEEAEIHNKALDEARITGLDKNCEVGMYGVFYYTPGHVQTFSGREVSDDVKVSGTTVTFRRNGKTFRGRLRKDAEFFTFKRVA